MEPEKSAEESSVRIDLEKLGRPGVHSFLILVPQKLDSASSDERILRDRTLRPFVVAGLLSKIPTALIPGSNIRSSFEREDGASYFMLPPGASRMHFATSFGEFYAYSNKENELSMLECRCSASEPLEARKIFLRSIYTALDHLSFACDAPTFLDRVSVFDVTHHTTHLFVVSPYRRRPIADSEKIIPLELRPVYAMYREAIAASSSFYKFLCFYKIIEGVSGKMRNETYIRAKKAGVTLSNERTKVPQDQDIPDDLKQYIGTSIKAFFDDVLTVQFRNAVAHLQTESGALDVSSPDELDRYAGLSLITCLCAREVIDSHERLLAQLPMADPI